MPHLSQTCKQCLTMERTIFGGGAFFLKAPSVKIFAMKHPNIQWRQLWQRDSVSKSFSSIFSFDFVFDIKVIFNNILANKIKTNYESIVFAIVKQRKASLVCLTSPLSPLCDADRSICNCDWSREYLVLGCRALFSHQVRAGPGQMFCISSLIKSTINIWFSQTIHWDETFLCTFYIFTTGLCNPENLNT